MPQFLLSLLLNLLRIDSCFIAAKAFLINRQHGNRGRAFRLYVAPFLGLFVRLQQLQQLRRNWLGVGFAWRSRDWQ